MNPKSHPLFLMVLLCLFLPHLSWGQFKEIDKKAQTLARQHYQLQRGLLAADDIDGHLELGFFCSEVGLFREAIQEFKKVLVAPNITLKAKQNVARLIATTEENAAITLYNQAIEARFKDHNYIAARQNLNDLLTNYPTTKMVPKAREQLQSVAKEDAIQKEIKKIEKKLSRTKTQNFIVFAPDKKLSQALAQKAEQKRGEIIQKLGFSIFPSWEKEPARIYVYATREDFLKYSPTEEWSGGWTQQVLQEDTSGNKQIVDRTVSTYADVHGLQDSVLPHEVAHLVFREFFGFSSNLPKWIDEGVAVWMEDKKHVKVGYLAQASKLASKSIPFDQFLFLNHYPSEPALFYAQAYSLVNFMVTRYGSDRFIKFIKELSLQKPLALSLDKAYQDEFLDLGDFEAVWKSWLTS